MGISVGCSVAVAAFFAGLIAFVFALGAPIFAVPIAVLAVVVIGAFDFQRRRRQARELHQMRDEAKADQVEFTARDKETLLSE